ncbi:FkbM family methyltransferase [Bradyrhizobium sp. JYMT SZCCT0428]|uniref:FkbM family methyltransferase n=1 Tax=Bradyrhizobium sp. JYMT SZCCT0428 TaxID=2807673 RepID=UPI001BAABFEE|nr:FkbM family methyltransferase [Bradyrhizobium sp. JYMT SZCCT0428]MBR1151580.1 FkbM family methyltransferase [Bradyrhizobium sp. JYMT SZCCT0428]
MTKNARIVRTEEIEIDTLDNILAGIRGHSNIFCKIDTQGYEEAVLRGAENSLVRLCGLQLELPIEHLYEGTWTLAQAMAKIDSLGFVPAQIRPTSFIRGDLVSWTELDCTFRRKS